MRSLLRFASGLAIGLALTIALFSVAAYAQQGGLEPKDMKLEVRRFIDSISRIGIPSATEVTVGTNGVVASPSSLHDAGYADDAGLSPTDASIGLDAQALDATSHTVTAATIGAVPMPSSLEVVLVDNVGTNDTLTCTSVRIDGFDAWGFKTGETVSTVSEVASFTNTPFAEVTSVVGTGCTSGTDALDRLRVASSLKVGLPVKIRQAADIEAVCVNDLDGTDSHCFTGAALSSNGALSTTYYTVDLGDSDIDTIVGTSVATGDGVYIRVRPWPARP